MKKSVLLAGLVLLCTTACHKIDYDAFGGHTDTTENPVRAYMLSLSDDLLAASLEELETALQLDPADPVAQALYLIQGDLHETRGHWTVRRECPLKGLVIRTFIKSEEQMGWLLEYEGNVELSGEAYPTTFTVQAERPMTEDHHTDWSITKFSGTRTEKEDYHCTFESSSDLVFEALPQDFLWNAFGTLHMNVYKGKSLIDNAYLSLKGAPSAAIFVHGI
jgi:hypothetical protein